MTPGVVPEVTVRPAAPEDLSGIARVFGAAFEDYRKGFGVDAETLAGLWRRSLGARIPATTVAALPDGSVVGFIVTVKPGAEEDFRGPRGKREARGEGLTWWRVLGPHRMWRIPALFLPMGVAYARRRRRKDELYVSLLGVDPAHQGRGIGQALLRAAEAEARAAGAAAVLLHTAAGNARARAAYRRAGYELVCAARALWAGPADIPVYVALRKPLGDDPTPRLDALERKGAG